MQYDVESVNRREIEDELQYKNVIETELEVSSTFFDLNDNSFASNVDFDIIELINNDAICAGAGVYITYLFEEEKVQIDEVVDEWVDMTQFFDLKEVTSKFYMLYKCPPPKRMTLKIVPKLELHEPFIYVEMARRLLAYARFDLLSF
ncbi:hypothetical protein LIER_43887 [Lithospermum erythrorhizon]|uniref:Uncharacterized protein n=1 Tax=Lithospermum erythrorhizon TaxID=34254 RepID=A0AAV3R3L1_LITER